MPTSPNTEAQQVEHAILHSPATSEWLRSSFKAAQHRDPLDALHDAEALAAVLRARCLTLFCDASPFDGEFTASLLKQHSNALTKLVTQAPRGFSEAKTSWLQSVVGTLATQIHDLAAKLTSTGHAVPPAAVPAPAAAAPTVADQTAAGGTPDKAVFEERLAFYRKEIKNPKNHDAIAMDLSFHKALERTQGAGVRA